MAEGADGEEEIQFLRTVSDAVSFFMDNNFFLKISLSSIAMYRFGFVYRHCYLFINPWILDIVPVYHRGEIILASHYTILCCLRGQQFNTAQYLILLLHLLSGLFLFI